MKDGLSFKAKIIALPCKAIYHAYCPWEDRFPALSHTAVVIPTLTPHTHPPPPENKINQTVARLYMECARKLGSSATPARVDRGMLLRVFYTRSQTSLSSYNNRITWNDTCLVPPSSRKP